MSREHVFYRFSPLDVLFFRGNALFGGPGQHSDALMPPWPSVFSGALRSEWVMKALGGRTSVEHAQRLAGLLRVTSVGLVDEQGRAWFSPPSDVVVFTGENPDDVSVETMALKDAKVLGVTSYPLPMVPVLGAVGKPGSGYWLDSEGLGACLRGRANDLQRHVSHVSSLWTTDYRLGIALDGESRTAAKGAIYTSDAIVLKRGVGFIVGVEPGPEFVRSPRFTVRLGGDGRAAQVSILRFDAPWRSGDGFAEIAASGRFKLVTATPGLFERGWVPDGVREDGDGRFFLDHDGARARLVAAQVGRHQVVSGWDLVQGRPKTAQRAVPAGSVYWFEVEEGGTDEVRTLLELLDARGTWALSGPVGGEGAARMAEGFNNVWVGAW